jgi:hypothetical protein
VDYKVVYYTDPDNQELVIAIVTLNYSQKRVPLIIIFASIYYLRKYFNNNINSNTLFAQSPTKFLNNKLSLVYLKHFNKFTKDSRKSKYKMLFFNKHSLHITQEFINYC